MLPFTPLPRDAGSADVVLFSLNTIALPRAGISRLRARPKGFPIALWKPSGPSSCFYSLIAACFYTILILNDYKDAVRRSAEGDASPVASPPKAEVESGATMTAKPSARLRRGEILCHIRKK